MSAKADRVKGILPIPEDRGLESGLVARPGPGSPCALDYPLMGKKWTLFTTAAQTRFPEWKRDRFSGRHV